jgi:hypothetical protein
MPKGYECLAGVCCGCGAVRFPDGVWRRIPGTSGIPQDLVTSSGGARTLYKVSHGYCPECFEVEMAKVREYHNAPVSVMA